MTTEQELREVLTKYGIGLEIRQYSKNDKVCLYPTRYKGIHREELSLRGHLVDCPIEEILKHSLSKIDLEDWTNKTNQAVKP